MARWALLGLALLLAALQFKLWHGEGGRAEVEELRKALREQEQVNAELRRRNADLAAEVEDLKTGEAAVEERARLELGMIKPGEVFYRVVPDAEGATQPTGKESTP
ncbi:cell division protein FtsB [Pseudomarimonas arenosa]|uniref:Cell division protein FtsB n=1 Tax=Pseudomarimonas arenosa TaxID=2774145 RepID=A0AAW3ZJ78_9GAMM|nr:cell division protein FtsB [Pseudomarimonas arenosa]MBD8524774.1 cell division protein FtsB [Pseudomarimonas arenosa]